MGRYQRYGAMDTQLDNRGRLAKGRLRSLGRVLCMAVCCVAESGIPLSNEWQNVYSKPRCSIGS